MIAFVTQRPEGHAELPQEQRDDVAYGQCTLAELIIYKTLPSRIHQLGSVYLRYLGEILKLPLLPSDKNLLAYFACRFFFLLFELEIRNA
jgi:hypothetical protein